MSKVSQPIIPQQREIWLVAFPKTTENRKPFRPCLIISNNQQNEFDEEIIALPLTTEAVIKGEVQTFEVLVGAKKETGLEQESRILTNRIHTFNKELRLRKKLGQVSSEVWEKVLGYLWRGIAGEK